MTLVDALCVVLVFSTTEPTLERGRLPLRPTPAGGDTVLRLPRNGRMRGIIHVHSARGLRRRGECLCTPKYRLLFPRSVAGCMATRHITCCTCSRQKLCGP